MAEDSSSDGDDDYVPPVHHEEAVGLDAVGTLLETPAAAAKQEAELEDFAAQLAALKAEKLAKKKKRKKKKSSSESTSETTGDGGSEESSKKKRRKKKKSKKTGEEPDIWSQSDERPYPYTVLLDRVFAIMKAVNPDHGKTERHTLPPPRTEFVGSRRTGWNNFKETCDIMHRSVDHVMSYFLVEMNTDGNLNEKRNIIVKGRWKPAQFESILRDYIREFVMCGNCRSPDTVLNRDSATRLSFLKCNKCFASRSVAPIKQGYKATTRDARRAARSAV